MFRVLFKEVAPFNIRLLTVQPGTFNTDFGNAVTLGKNALPDDYKGSEPEHVMQLMMSGNFAPNSDKDKAMKAVYEVIVGEGVGAGHEAERLLPLGKDITARIDLTKNYYSHAMEVFGDVCNGVALE
jgi:NAD(P)-dependent dehydrogenase (short-subunit alcohol dehydrogenase family)